MDFEKKIIIKETGFSEQMIAKNNSGYLFEKTDSDVLLITFGGIQQNIAMPVFEFFNSIQKHKVNKLFIRDFNQSWYHEGALSIGDTIQSIERFIRTIIVDNKIKKIVIIGNSAGGYAALLFGFLLSADIVHAFAPQTFLDSFNRLMHWDRRWMDQVRGIKKTAGTSSFLDLKKYINKPVTGDFHIYYCKNNRLDKIHALRFKNKANFTMHAYDNGGHAVIKYLKETGELEQIFTSSLSANRS